MIFRATCLLTEPCLQGVKGGGSTGRTPCPHDLCAVERRRFPVGVNPTRQPLQPEATGAAMEVTKWLKPSDSGHDLR
jgi:hypothetical protein